jgi:serine/threonine-protein kinase
MVNLLMAGVSAPFALPCSPALCFGPSMLAESSGQSRVGRVLHDKYRLVRLIGSGGTACVYEAVHRNGHRVAIKMLHPELSRDRELRTRFLREGYVANKVAHPGVVRVTDDDTAEDGAVFLVMELLEVETIESRVQRSGGRLAEHEVSALAREVLTILTVAHASGVVHRDIKPDNLFRTSDGVLKILDFGIARLRDFTGPGTSTVTGHMMGTPAFMAPEQALGRIKEIDGRTDLYALGATMFTLLSGSYVHETKTMEEMLVRVGSEPARSLAEVAPGVSPAVVSIVDRALAFEMSARWASAREMARALAEASGEPFASEPGPAPDRRRGVRLGMALGAVVLAAVGAGIAAKTRALGTPQPAAAPAPVSKSAPQHSAPDGVPVLSSEVPLPAVPVPAETSPTSSVRPRASGPVRAPARAGAPASKDAGNVVSSPAEHVLKNCDPPYFTDSAGHRQYKVECL